jgi:hypothetical protein
MASGWRLPATTRNPNDRWAAYNKGMKPDATRDRRRFRFSLRMLFVLVTVICLWLGWNARTVNARRALLAEIESRGGQAICGPEVIGLRCWSPALLFVETDVPVSPIRRLLGDSVVEVIYLPSAAFSCDDGDRIQDVFPEALLLPGPFGMQTMVPYGTGES